MGKAQIVSGGASGHYLIRILWDRARAQARIARLDAEIASLDVKIAGIAAEIESLRIAYEKAKAMRSPPTPFPELAAMASAIAAKQAQHDLCLVERSSRGATRLLLQAIPPDANATAWCADLTTDLSGDVGTIEPKGEPGEYIIRPGYDGRAAYNAARDGQIQPAASNTPEGTFLNKALLPGWQKWMPRYRLGTITAIDTSKNTCSVSLDSAASREKPRGRDLDINQGTSLNDVPVEYMTCNARAFAVDDRVVVEFAGQDFAKPKVIGFESNPKACGEYFVWIQGCTPSVGGQYRSVVVWDIVGNRPADGFGFSVPCDYNDPAFQAWWNARTKVQTETWFDTASAIERYSTSIEPSVPFNPTQWEYSRIVESLMPWSLPAALEPLQYPGGGDEASLYRHNAPCSLSNGDGDGLLYLNPAHDGYVRRFQSQTGSLDDITGITNHFLINAYKLPTGAPGSEMLDSRYLARTGPPIRYWWNRITLESLYNTNSENGTHEKWTERYRTPFGVMHTNQGYKQLHYTRMTDGVYYWGKYDYVLTDWIVGYRKAPSFFWSFARNTGKSLVVVCVCRGQIATETYYWEEGHGSVDRYESEHTIIWEDRFFKVHAFAIAADDIGTAEIPEQNNEGLSALIEACYDHSYALAGITDRKVNEYETSAQYIAY